ncbi:hypothetical protein GCM10010238_64000 [Streptomyces griseoviridis]|uniref:Uncharacterized protein n=1 Tax=Streptomyces griseoviridis TaxID=45398 RepID=A0A918GWP8_STRGD|nr:hypothetical protein GCM10010238_64000 [Streptomyces niveoruber]
MPAPVLSYSVRGGPPAGDGAVSWARSSPCFAGCFRAWWIGPGLGVRPVVGAPVLQVVADLVAVGPPVPADRAEHEQADH